jgi:hypothetical protein
VASLRLARIEHMVFEAGRPVPEVDRGYFTDLMSSYGMECSADAFTRDCNTYRHMVEALLPRLGSLGDRFDMAVMAIATPDAEPGWPMSYLTGAVSSPGLAFAISDQGTAAPFTALGLLLGSPGDYGARRAQLWVMDQSALMHDAPVPPRLRPTVDSAVAMILDEGEGTGQLSVIQLTGVRPGDVPSHLGHWAKRARGGGATAAVCGTGLAPYWSPAWADEVRWARPGLPCTGVWACLADALPSWRATRPSVMIAEYDEELGYLSMCALDLAGMDEEGETV